jgi:RNA polymerase sigma factor (sigma-70 family)
MHSKYPRFDRDDLRSVALLALVESATTWNPHCARFSTWSGRCIEWALADYIRAQRRRIRICQGPVVSIDDLSPADTLHLTDKRPGPESKATTRILATRIGKAVEQLPAPAPDILKLFYVKGWTLRRIAEALEMSESRVGQIHAGAVERLKNRFKLKPARPGTYSDTELMNLVRQAGPIGHAAARNRSTRC